MYIDGKVDGEAVSGSDVRFDYIEFGLSIAENLGGGTFFNGAMDEVKIWSVAFTADEVQESMRVALAATGPAGKLTTKWAQMKSWQTKSIGFNLNPDIDPSKYAVDLES